MNYHNPSQELVTVCLYTVVILFLLSIVLAVVLYRFHARIVIYLHEKDETSNELVELKTINFDLRNNIKKKEESFINLKAQFSGDNEENLLKIKDLECINDKLNNQISDLLYQLNDEKDKAIWLSKEGIKGNLLTYLENYRKLLKKGVFNSDDFTKISKEYNSLFTTTKVVTTMKDISMTLNYVDPVRIGTLSNKEINKNITALKRLVFKL